jgi:hypothetical protein
MGSVADELLGENASLAPPTIPDDDIAWPHADGPAGDLMRGPSFWPR